MKVIFETDDQMEIKRIAKSLDMACFIFELKNNAFRKFESEEADAIFDEISKLLAQFKIDIEDLID